MQSETTQPLALAWVKGIGIWIGIYVITKILTMFGLTGYLLVGLIYLGLIIVYLWKFASLQTFFLNRCLGVDEGATFTLIAVCSLLMFPYPIVVGPLVALATLNLLRKKCKLE